MNHQLLINLKNFFKWHYKEICGSFQRKNKKNCGSLQERRIERKPVARPHFFLSQPTPPSPDWPESVSPGEKYSYTSDCFDSSTSPFRSPWLWTLSPVQPPLFPLPWQVHVLRSSGVLVQSRTRDYHNNLVFSPSLSKSSYLCFEGALWNRGFCRHRRPSWILHLPVEAPPSSTFGSLVDKEVDHSACTPLSRAAPPWYCTWTAPHLWSLWGWPRLGNDSLQVCKVFLLSRETQQVFQGFWKSWIHLWSIIAEMASFYNLRVGGRRSESVPRFIFSICLIGVDPFEDPLEDPLEEPRDDLLIFCLKI